MSNELFKWLTWKINRPLIIVVAVAMIGACNERPTIQKSLADKTETNANSPSKVTKQGHESISSKNPKKFAVSGQQKWGDVKGQIVFRGTIPKSVESKPTNVDDKAYCKENDIKILISEFDIDATTKGMANVFVMLYHGSDADKGAALPWHDSYNAMKAEKVIIDNNKLQFSPRHTILVVGQELVLRNSDKVGHNVRLASGKNAFNVNLPQLSDVSLGQEVKFAERIPRPIECNMHTWMQSRLLVRHEPYHALTESKGNFEIKHMPLGKYKLQFYYNKYVQLDDKKGNRLTDKRGTIDIEIKSGETFDLGTMTFWLK